MGSVVGMRRTEPALIRDGRFRVEGRLQRLGGDVRQSASSAVTYTTCFHCLVLQPVAAPAPPPPPPLLLRRSFAGSSSV